MSFDFRSLAPTPSCWLETRIRYTGRGRAVFSNPPGEIEGPAEVTFTRGGRARVVITPERVAPERLTLLRGQSQGDYRRNGMQNPCASVEVRTEGGVFSSTTDRNKLGDRSMRAEVGEALELRPLRSEFVADDSATAEYWALPLTNFVTDDWAAYRDCPELDTHPLRGTRMPPIPQELTDEERVRAELIALCHNRLITFCLGDGGIGFIEPMPGYAKRVERLKQGTHRNQFTAVAVGPANVQRVTWDDDVTLFPRDVLALLNLTTGTGVGAPWVEFRDATGKLVRRCHIPFGAAKYCDSWGTVGGHSSRNAIGELLTCGFRSGQFGRRPFRVVLHQVRTGTERGTQEGQFLTLCRAFETLCHEQGLQTQNLAASLTADQAGEIAQILDDARARIRALAGGESDGRRRDVVVRIADKVLGATQLDRRFGLAVFDLAARYGLHDAVILDPHLSTHPICGSGTWAAVLSQLRGAATHEAYFDIGGRHDLWDIQRVLDHLHDLLLRVIWKIVGYGGPYRTPIPPSREQPNADWVTPTTTARELGFE